MSENNEQKLSFAQWLQSACEQLKDPDLITLDRLLKKEQRCQAYLNECKDWLKEASKESRGSYISDEYTRLSRMQSDPQSNSLGAEIQRRAAQEAMSYGDATEDYYEAKKYVDHYQSKLQRIQKSINSVSQRIVQRIQNNEIDLASLSPATQSKYEDVLKASKTDYDFDREI